MPSPPRAVVRAVSAAAVCVGLVGCVAVAVPRGATPDPMTAPVRPRSELSAPPLPAATSVGEDVVRTWTLTARSDDDRALLVTAAVTTCEGFDRFEVTQNDSYVLVAAHVRSPGLLTYCVSNVPRVTAVSYVVELSEPLGSRPLLHAAASPAG